MLKAFSLLLLVAFVVKELTYITFGFFFCLSQNYQT